MKAIWNGKVIAESDDTVIVDGNHYFPRSSLIEANFEASNHTSVCGWKGLASYLSVVVDGTRNDNAAWLYAEPMAAAAQIKGHVAFWRGVEVRA